MKASLKIQCYLGISCLFLMLAQASLFAHLLLGVIGIMPLKHPGWEFLALAGLLIGFNKLSDHTQRRLAHLRAIGEAPPLPTPEEMEIEKKKIQRHRVILGIVGLIVLVVAYTVIMIVKSNNEKAARLENEQRLNSQEKAHQ